MLASTVVLLLAIMSRFNGFKIYDDAYMFVRYADHILAGHGMVWNVGEGPAYGATSLAYVFLLIPFRLVCPDNPALALFSASFFWGKAFIGLLFRMALKTMQPTTAFKPYLAGFLFLSLMATIIMLRAHFVSGMETTLVLSYLTICIMLWEELRLGKGNAWQVGIVSGIAWWIRPDLLIFCWGIPGMMVLFSTPGIQRATWLRVLMVAIACTLLGVVGAKMVTGTWLPLSFFAKSTGLYGLEFAAKYRWLPLAEMARFVARNWPSILMIGMGIFLKWKRLRLGYSALDKAVMVVMLGFVVYFTFFVLQVMGYGQRFYYPLLPFLLYLALRELLELPENIRLGHGLKFNRIPHQTERMGIAILGGLLLYYGFSFGWEMKQSPLNERFAIFDAKATYQAEAKDYLPKLDALGRFPDDLSIATTEVGMPSALYPNRIVYDLAALNSPVLMAEGLTAATILKYCPADILYLPHPDYKQLNTDLAASSEFAAHYAVVPKDSLKAMMGVAIRKDGKYAGDLMEVFGK